MFDADSAYRIHGFFHLFRSTQKQHHLELKVKSSGPLWQHAMKRRRGGEEERRKEVEKVEELEEVDEGEFLFRIRKSLRQIRLTYFESLFKEELKIHITKYIFNF